MGLPGAVQGAHCSPLTTIPPPIVGGWRRLRPVLTRNINKRDDSVLRRPPELTESSGLISLFARYASCLSSMMGITGLSGISSVVLGGQPGEGVGHRSSRGNDCWFRGYRFGL